MKSKISLNLPPTPGQAQEAPAKTEQPAPQKAQTPPQATQAPPQPPTPPSDPPAAREDPSRPEQEERDWRSEAIKDPTIRARFDEALFGKQEPPKPPPETPLQVARRELDELEADLTGSALTKADLGNADKVAKWMDLQQRHAQASGRVARLAAEEAQSYRQQAETARRVTGAVKQNAERLRQQRPEFTPEMEAGLSQYMEANNVRPEVLADPLVYEKVAKAYLYDQLVAGQNTGPTVPPPVAGQQYLQRGTPTTPAQPVDPEAPARATYWGTTPEAVAKYTTGANGKPLEYSRHGHDVPYFDIQPRRRRRGR